MLASFPKVPKTQRPKALKIYVFDYPTIVWRPLSGQHREYTHKPYIGTNYNYCAISSSLILCVYVHWNFCGGLRKTHVFWNRVHNGPSRSSKVTDFGTNRNRICNFLLVVNSNLGPISPRFRDIAGFLLRTSTPAQFHPNFGGVPLGLDWCCGFDERRP